MHRSSRPRGAPRGTTALWCLLLAPLAAACHEPSPGASRTHQGRVVGGTPAQGDPAVVAILLRRTGCGDSAPPPLCTGTLIGPDVVLTAAHCLDGLSPRALEVVFGPSTAAATELRLVAEARIHPAWNPETWEADLALLRLDRAVQVTPVPLPERPMDATDLTAEVRVVGYGESRDEAQPMGTKLEGFGSVSAVDASAFTFTPGPAMTCHGDSGGPVFITRDGTELLVGVTSHGDPGCAEYGVNTRVDAFQEAFIDPFLNQVPNWPESRIDLEGICGDTCVTDDDCPALLDCEVMLSPPRCVLRNVPPGDLAEPCTVDDDCDSGRCARLGGAATPECRCHTPCDTGIIPSDPAPPKGCGCQAPPPSHPRGPLSFSWLWIAIVLTLLRRARRRNQ